MSSQLYCNDRPNMTRPAKPKSVGNSAGTDNPLDGGLRFHGVPHDADMSLKGFSAARANRQALKKKGIHDRFSMCNAPSSVLVLA
jgi:hypothetical protein